MTAAAPNIDVVDLDMVGWVIAQNALASVWVSGTPAHMVPRVASDVTTFPVEGIIVTGAVVFRKAALHPSPQIEPSVNL